MQGLLKHLLAVCAALFLSSSLGRTAPPPPLPGINPSPDEGQPVSLPAAPPGANGQYPAPPEFTWSGPQGQTLHFTISDSTIYPGTENDITVYVPSSYTPDKPACLFLRLDGIAKYEPAAVENLIAQHQIPMMILVGVTPGTLWKDKAKKEIYHHNRTYEFDSTNDNFPDFLEREVLPEVEKQVTPDGKPIRLSHKAKDRGISGASTGGIGAFTVAWRRPDLFTRVYSTIGTFIAMRGGEEYPTYIRKTEPKPLRVFLEDGYSDAWNPLFGSWFMANQSMETALTFAHYDVAHLWANHAHDARASAAIYPDVMRWLWRDWPSAPQAGVSDNNKLKQILAPGETWRLVGDGYKAAGGPRGQPRRRRRLHRSARPRYL